MILTGYIVIYAYLFILLLIASVLYKLNIKGVIIRKIMHIMLSFAWFISYYFFGATIHLLIPPITFVIFNILAYKYNIFAWTDQDKSKGIIYYPISFLILGIITYFNPEFYYAFGIGFLCMGLADGLAPLTADYFKSREIINNKTITGTLTVLIVSLLVALWFSLFFNLEFSIFKIIIIGIVAALLELIGQDGLDNLYVPIGIALVVYLLGVV